MFRAILVGLILIISGLAFGQVAEQDTTGKTMGVSVSPSSLHLSIKPGTSATKEITINNATKSEKKFQLGFADYLMDETGGMMPITEDKQKYGLSKWITPSPSYIELKPFEKRKVKLLISIPDTAFFAAWTICTIDEVVERKPLDAKLNKDAYGFGVYNSIGFGIYIFQNPPNVKVNNVEIRNFAVVETDGVKKIHLTVENVGDGIGYSASYVEYANLKTGSSFRGEMKRFSVLPGNKRTLFFDIPANIEKGKYSLVGVVDFGSKEEIKAAEMEYVFE